MRITSPANTVQTAATNAVPTSRGTTAYVLLVFVLIAGWGTQDAFAANEKSKPLSRLANEITTKLFGDNYCKSTNQELRTVVGIWPFRENENSISATTGRHVRSQLLEEAVKAKPDCIDYLDNEEFAQLAKSALEQFGSDSGDAGYATLAHRLDFNLDVILVPFVQREINQVRISLQAFPANARTMHVETEWMELGNPTPEIMAAASKNLDDVLSQAASYLIAHSAGMRSLHPAGLYFRTGGAQPELARFLMAKLVATMTRQYAAAHGGQALEVSNYANVFSALRGLQVKPRDLDPLKNTEQKAETGSHFELSGQYWLRDDGIEISLSLRNSKQETVSWTGWISNSLLPELKAKPSNAIAAVAASDTTKNGFLLTSPRAHNPVFSAGDKLTAFLHLEKSSWLYCFYIDAEGHTTQVVPNEFQDGQESRFFEAGLLHSLPDPKVDPFEFVISDNTRGEEVLKCFASPRDITSELPLKLRGKSLQPLPENLSSRLDEIFRHVGGNDVQFSTLTVTVD